MNKLSDKNVEKNNMSLCGLLSETKVSGNTNNHNYTNKELELPNSKELKSVLYQESRIPIVRYEEDNKKVLLRKKQLFDKLTDNKLEYMRDGMCDSFIKFGIPELNTVIKGVQQKTVVQSKRLTLLLKHLKKKGELYDETNSYYKKYIKYGGELDYHIDEGIKEWFYIHKTKYSEYIKIYKDEDKAQTKAFNEYIKNNGHDKYTDRICQTEMIVRLF